MKSSCHVTLKLGYTLGIAGVILCAALSLVSHQSSLKSSARIQTSISEQNRNTVAHLKADAEPDSAESIEVVGEFLYVKHDRKVGDTWGYSVQLWREEDRMFGLLSAYLGSEADPPTGLLEDVKFNSTTNQLSFTTRLSTGIVFDSNNRAVRSKDTLDFKGALRPSTIVGILKISSASSQATSIKRIRLHRSAMLSQDMMTAKTYREWRTWADKILERLGPKC